MKVKLYADENFPLRTIEELRAIGHDVLTTFEDGKANFAVPDKEILSREIELNRAVLTLNRQDFKRLHNQNSEHAGIIICTEDPDRLGQAKRISENLAEFANLHGQLIRVYRPSK